jgi:hypothetical protein
MHDGVLIVSGSAVFADALLLKQWLQQYLQHQFTHCRTLQLLLLPSISVLCTM